MPTINIEPIAAYLESKQYRVTRGTGLRGEPGAIIGFNEPQSVLVETGTQLNGMAIRHAMTGLTNGTIVVFNAIIQRSEVFLLCDPGVFDKIESHLAKRTHDV